MTGPQAHWLKEGRRLHLHHGPIDLIIDAEGPDAAAAFTAAHGRFQTILTELVEELDHLRRPLGRYKFHHPTARRMANAIQPFDDYATPMAAVAGSVADEILSAMTPLKLTRANVNNGGDIAFHLAPGETVQALGPAGPVRIAHRDPVRGLATSGRTGRSLSLGIADAVTVAAPTAAAADAAATLIANRVDLPGHPAITRTPAAQIDPDSDLGTRLVTTALGPLTPSEIAAALSSGQSFAQRLVARGLITSAALSLCGQTRTTTSTKALTHA